MQKKLWLCLLLFVMLGVTARADMYGVIFTFTQSVITSTSQEYEVTVSYDEESGIPIGSVLKVREIEKGSQEYQSYLFATEGSIEGRITDAGFLDIEIEYKGKKIEPKKPVMVDIRKLEQALSGDEVVLAGMNLPVEDEASDQSIINIIHFQEDGYTEVIDTFISNDDVMQFNATSFSIYGIIYTVDFAFEVDGKEYEFSIPGGGAVCLGDLVHKLGIAASDEAAEKFLEEVENVVFSDPDLVWVGKTDEVTTVGKLIEKYDLELKHSDDLTEKQIEDFNTQKVDSGDWVLISLKAFDTEEMLTVTMKDGKQWTVKVTDASYTGTEGTNLEGKKVALINVMNENALQDSAHDTAGRLKAVGITYDDTTSMVMPRNINDRVTGWTFAKVQGSQDQYYIRSDRGYLNININGVSGLTVTNTPQALKVESKDDGRIRITRPNSSEAVNDWSNSVNEGYAVYNNGGPDNRGEWFTPFELSNVIQTIALNPMNENGVYPGNPNSKYITSTHYKNMTIDGHKIENEDSLHYSRIFIPVRYDDNGLAIITLPSNEDLTKDGGFSVSDADPSKHSIVQDPNKPQWVLRGWVNIADDNNDGVFEYYDVTKGPVTATVNREKLDVFYADWASANYDYTITDPINTADTSGFIKIGVWDYNELYNLKTATTYKVDADNREYQPRDTIENEEWYINHTTLQGGDFVQFVDNTDSSKCWQYGTLGNTQDRGREDENQWSNYSGWTPRWGIAGNWGQEASTGVIEALFDTSNTPGSGVTYLGQANYLFSYDPDKKKYSYDSEINGAVYNKSQQRFFVANAPKRHETYVYPDHDVPRTGFLPFNDYYTPLNYRNGSTNYWFGMSTELNFWLPDVPGVSNANKIGSQNDDMVFSFRGDDDVWVFIDGKLALDIGGIHEALSGSINFSTGVIKVQTGTNSEATWSLNNMGIGAGSHKLAFYYVERGANASNCKITFNLMPRWVQEPAKVSTAKVIKRWSEDTPEERKKELKFTLNSGSDALNTVGYDDGTTTGTTWSYVWEGLDPDKDYTVKEAPSDYFNMTISDQIVENGTYEYWAPTGYDDTIAYGVNTVVIGNGKNNNGRLLKSDGSSVAASISYDAVKSKDVNYTVKWTIFEYNTTDKHFYIKNSEGKFISIQNDNITLVNAQNEASWFYMGPTGDLNDANSNHRLAIDENGNITIKDKMSSELAGTESTDRVHIYAHQNIDTKMFIYTADNTYLKPADCTLIKVDKATGRPIGNAKFTLLKGSSSVDFSKLSLTSLTDSSTLQAEDYLLNETNIKVITVPNGGIKISGLVNGTYTFKEVAAPDGYVISDKTITFVVENGVVKNADGSVHENEAADITFKIENEPGAELPATGGSGVMPIYALGLFMITFGAVTLLLKRRSTIF